MSEEVKLIAEVLWKFHNDRLEDPSIKEMKPYIEPILESNRQVLQRLEEKLLANKVYVNNGELDKAYKAFEAVPVDTITAQIKKEMEKLNGEQ